jgi:hypothetical protein
VRFNLTFFHFVITKGRFEPTLVRSNALILCANAANLRFITLKLRANAVKVCFIRIQLDFNAINLRSNALKRLFIHSKSSFIHAGFDFVRL